MIFTKMTTTAPPTVCVQAWLGKAALKSALGAAVAMGVLGAGQAQALVVTASAPAGVSIFQYYLNGVLQPGSQILQGFPDLIPLDSPITVTFVEDPSNFSLTILGGTFNKPTKQSFALGGKYWGLSFNINQDGDKVNSDTLYIQGSSIHVSDPHESSVGASSPVAFRVFSGMTDFENRLVPNPVTHSNGHSDVYKSLVSQQKEGNQFKTYSYQLSSRHVPAPLPILGLGAFFGYNRKLRKLFKASKPELISPI